LGYGPPPQHQTLGIASLPRLRSLRVASALGLDFYRQLVAECENTGLEKLVLEGRAATLVFQFGEAICQPFIAAVLRSPTTQIQFILNVQSHFERGRNFLFTAGTALAALGAQDLISLQSIDPPTSLSTYADAHVAW